MFPAVQAVQLHHDARFSQISPCQLMRVCCMVLYEHCNINKTKQWMNAALCSPLFLAGSASKNDGGKGAWSGGEVILVRSLFRVKNWTSTRTALAALGRLLRRGTTCTCVLGRVMALECLLSLTDAPPTTPLRDDGRLADTACKPVRCVGSR